MTTIRLCLADEVMYHVINDDSSIRIWTKLESKYMSKSLTNKLFLKQKLFWLKMVEGSDLFSILIRSMVLLVIYYELR